VLAAAWVFRERYFDMLYLKKNNNFFNKKKLKITHIFIGMIPAGVLGLLFDDFIEENLFSIPTVIVGLFLGAVYMIVADIVNKKYSVKKNLDEITYLQAFIIGLSQSIALWPGFSRSGSTISTGSLLGFSHKASSNFTFIMAVPIMLGASLLSLFKNIEDIEMNHFAFYLIGFITSFVVSILTIRLFLKLINRIKLIPFAIYRIILASILAFIYYF
ncbi:TPA: undecaprenyl-diphosphate phosphatase, partial [Staphylococcus aureus]|nr:undecaprenyl-diphosphate phosphatase [Staphylococcus aureus]